MPIIRVRVKHALARPRTPSHALSPYRPKTPHPLPAVRPPGGLPTVHPISDPYPSHIKVRACFTLGVKHALSFFSCEKLRACFTQRGKTRPQAAMGLTWSLWHCLSDMVSLTWSLWHGPPYMVELRLPGIHILKLNTPLQICCCPVHYGQRGDGN